jgi:5-formyltetrahydrofolate cyclo-ligase
MHPAELTKAALRTRMRQILDALPAAHWARASERVCKGIAGLAVFREARAVFAFVPIAGEVDITPLLRVCLAQGKTLCLPRIDWTTKTMVPAEVTALDDTQLEVTRHAIRQPRPTCPGFSASQIDLILVPGLAFSVNPGANPGGTVSRLGRGAGFYDRYFAAQSGGRGVTLGVALSEQVLASIPVDPWDLSVRAVATPDGVLGSV